MGLEYLPSAITRAGSGTKLRSDSGQALGREIGHRPNFVRTPGNRSGGCAAIGRTAFGLRALTRELEEVRRVFEFDDEFDEFDDEDEFDPNTRTPEHPNT